MSPVDRMNAGKERAALARYRDNGRAYGGARADRLAKHDPHESEHSFANRIEAIKARFHAACDYARDRHYTAAGVYKTADEIPF